MVARVTKVASVSARFSKYGETLVSFQSGEGALDYPARCCRARDAAPERAVDENLGGTSSSNPVLSSGESGELSYCAAGLSLYDPRGRRATRHPSLWRESPL